MEYPQHELQAIAVQLMERIEDVLQHFDIKYNKFHNRYAFPCPIHQGDNPNGAAIFTNGTSIIGNWKCWTHECDAAYGKGVLSFIKGILSTKTNTEVKFGEAVLWAKNFIGDVVCEEPVISQNNEFINITQYFNKKNTSLSGNMSREEFRKKIIIPAEYYLKRKYRPETLDKFDVGLCVDKTDRFFSRIVIPIYDQFGEKVVASVARTTQPHCAICNKYHFANRPCPQNKIEEIWSQKWLNSTGFKKSAYLYNFWNAKEHIMNTGKAILVEGQGDVWRLVEAEIYNSLGMFGCELSEEQMILLEKSGAMDLLVLTDNDPPGIQAREKIRKKCSRVYNVKFMDLPDKDFGDMTVEEIKEFFNGPKCIL